MKQTSLLQSWKRTTPFLTPAPLDSNSVNPTERRITEAPKKFNITPSIQWCSDAKEDDDDRLLAGFLDEHTATTVQEACKNKDILSTLRDRPTLIYYSTANDSENLPGFERDAGSKWIYPINFPLREYQFNIAEQCLYKNTLVCLPTGLGKTFIAAVVLHNFMRWYPCGKSVFMAPTRPLVNQQLIACQQLIGMCDRYEITELTGSVPQAKRQRLWNSMRGFFLTPQVLANDLRSEICPAKDIRLLIFDEAHKATGNHAYCQVLRMMTDTPYMHRQFRIIGLSATPASDVQGVQTVIANLLISHLELRTETSADVQQYVQHRQLESVVVPLGPELTHFRDRLVECARMPLERLCMFGALRMGRGDIRPEHMSKFTIVKAREEWGSNPKVSSLTSTDAGSVQCDFGVAICLLHAIELLMQHGLRPLYQYISGVLSGQRASPSVRAEIKRLPGMDNLCTDLYSHFSSNYLEQGNSSQSGNPFDPFCSQMPFTGGHPKLKKLREILCEHFRQGTAISVTNETRVIVFSQFRDSVEEIMHMLKQLRPLVRPASFIGQGSANSNRSPKFTDSPQLDRPQPMGSSGITQRDQLRVMNEFRSGVVNTLVSTCVGEEGIDVGQVDLIVCFDAFKSPIRLMQRLGRTGRQKVGKIIMLLTEGREERNHAVSLARSSSIYKALLEGRAYQKLAFYPHNPRMVPIGLHPKVAFEKLEEPQTTDLRQITDTKPLDKHFKTRASRKPRDFLCHDMRNEKEQPQLSLREIGPCPLISQSVKSQTSSFCLTSFHNLTSRHRLTSMRENLQSVTSVEGKRTTGPSTSTRHFISLLRLAELHRRGFTQLSYHALGLRSINTDLSMTELIKQFDPEFTDTQDAISSRMNDMSDSHTEPIIEKLSSIEKTDKVPVNSKRNTIALPISFKHTVPLVKGLVSGEFFFETSFHYGGTSTTHCANGLADLGNVIDKPISKESLQQVWNQWLTEMAHESPQISENVNEFQVGKLEQWIDSSLLEAIAAKDYDSPPTVQPKLTESEQTIISDRQRLASAFCLPSPSHSLRLEADARSTPQNGKLSTFKKHISNSHSQIDLTEALALLDKSSTLLDMSEILPVTCDPISVSNIQTKQSQSVLFVEPTRPLPITNNHSTLEFSTRLSLGSAFEDDLLLPSQLNNCIAESSPKRQEIDQNVELSSPPIYSQINWSPIPISDVSDWENAKQTQQSIFGTNQIEEQSTEIDSSPLRTGIRGCRYQNALLSQRISKQIDCSARKAKRHKRFGARSLFLTQAGECGSGSPDKSSYEESDGCESSFIDDLISDHPSDDLEMMGIYLRSIRSPVNMNNPRRGKRHSTGEERNTNEKKLHIYSQEPETDDYLLDTFCVESPIQSSNSRNRNSTPGPTHKRICID